MNITMNKFCLIFICGITFCSCKQSHSTNNTTSPKVTKVIAVDKITPELAAATLKYEELSDFHEGLAAAKKNGKWGFINKLGEEIISCKFDEVDEFKNGLAIVRTTIDENNDKVGCINQNGKMVIPQIYGEIYDFNSNIATVYVDGKYGAIDINGKTIIPVEYEHVGKFSDGLAVVHNEEGKVGYMDVSGKLVIPFIYINQIYADFSEGLACVQNQNRKYGYIDKNGNTVIPFIYDWAKPFNSGYAAVGFNERVENRFFYHYSSSYINKRGQFVMKQIEGECFDFSEDGYAIIRIENEGEGIIDTSFNLVLLPDGLSFVSPFSTNGLIPVKNYENGKYGLLDAKRKDFIIPFEYDFMHYAFQEGYIGAYKNDKLGFIDKSGKEVIPFSYDAGSPFSEGFAAVERYGKWGYVDRYGNDTFSVN